ncbi:MAG: hypothetical protein GX594_17110 [Pirellulaceae bacterium]|nr:hypothetical protein [Pirellulaceae bacterium]
MKTMDEVHEPGEQSRYVFIERARCPMCNSAVNRPSIQKAIETAVWATTEHLAAVGGKSRRPRARK